MKAITLHGLAVWDLPGAHASRIATKENRVIGRELVILTGRIGQTDWVLSSESKGDKLESGTLSLEGITRENEGLSLGTTE